MLTIQGTVRLVLGLAVPIFLGSAITLDHLKDFTHPALSRNGTDSNKFQESLGLHSRNKLNGFSRMPGQAQLMFVWGQRGESLSSASGLYVWVKDTVKFIVGAVLVVLSVPALWFYERQRARVDCLFYAARSACYSAISKSEASVLNAGYLLHVAGATRPVQAVQDPRFPGVKLPSDCVRLRTEVQVYQSIGRKHAKGPSANDPRATGKDSGQGEDWSEVEHLLPGPQGAGLRSPAPPGLRLGTTIVNCGRVELGRGYVIPDALVDQCRDFKPMDDLLPASVTTSNGQLTFTKHADGYFYWRQGTPCCTPSDKDEARPRAGDTRVRFQYVPPGVVTVLALQVEEANKPHMMTFTPFRLIKRPLCGLAGEDAERQALMVESKKSREQLAREDQCLPGSWLCCGCNLVARCCTGVLTPEIFRLFEGTRTLDEALQDAMPLSFFNPCIVRFFLFASMCTGLILQAFAIEVFAPFLKELPLAHALGNWARPGIGCVFTLTTMLFMISVAYFPFRPLVSMTGIGAIVAAITMLNWLVMSPKEMHTSDSYNLRGNT